MTWCPVCDTFFLDSFACEMSTIFNYNSTCWIHFVAFVTRVNCFPDSFLHDWIAFKRCKSRAHHHSICSFHWQSLLVRDSSSFFPVTVFLSFSSLSASIHFFISLSSLNLDSLDTLYFTTSLTCVPNYDFFFNFLSSLRLLIYLNVYQEGEFQEWMTLVWYVLKENKKRWRGKKLKEKRKDRMWGRISESDIRELTQKSRFEGTTQLLFYDLFMKNRLSPLTLFFSLYFSLFVSLFLFPPKSVRNQVLTRNPLLFIPNLPSCAEWTRMIQKRRRGAGKRGEFRLSFLCNILRILFLIIHPLHHHFASFFLDFQPESTCLISFTNTSLFMYSLSLFLSLSFSLQTDSSPSLFLHIFPLLDSSAHTSFPISRHEI